MSCEFPICELRANINTNNNDTHILAISILCNQSATWATSVGNGDISWQWQHQLCNSFVLSVIDFIFGMVLV